MTTSSQHTRRGEHAVIIGASMGGLVAAAAVAPYFDRVSVLDRDTLPSGPDHRKGVPQSKHTHGFQPGGLKALDDLLPGLSDSLVASGAKPGDVSERCGWYVGGGDLARGVSGFRGMGFTRPFVEHAVRSRVAALVNVTLRDGTEVVRPLTREGAVVVGVEITPTGRHETDALSADLVIDASQHAAVADQHVVAIGVGRGPGSLPVRHRPFSTAHPARLLELGECSDRQQEPMALQTADFGVLDRAVGALQHGAPLDLGERSAFRTVCGVHGPPFPLVGCHCKSR